MEEKDKHTKYKAGGRDNFAVVNFFPFFFCFVPRMLERVEEGKQYRTGFLRFAVEETWDEY